MERPSLPPGVQCGTTASILHGTTHTLLLLAVRQRRFPGPPRKGNFDPKFRQIIFLLRRKNSSRRPARSYARQHPRPTARGCGRTFGREGEGRGAGPNSDSPKLFLSNSSEKKIFRCPSTTARKRLNIGESNLAKDGRGNFSLRTVQKNRDGCGFYRVHPAYLVG